MMKTDATIWLDAAEFQDYGGFTLETQFVQEMGQAYLLALDRPGIPVEAAKARIDIREEGMYRIWIRTKNWLRGYAPGRLEASVDGVHLKAEIGTQPNGQWYWEICGDRYLGLGEHTVKISDTTGYFGRFSAIVLTTDLDYVPDHGIDRMRKERARIRNEDTGNVEGGSFDLLVAGAGPAGIPAAIAAARNGLSVCLISSRPGLGGNASDEGTVGLDGAAPLHFGMREGGIAEEIRRIRDFEHLSWEGAMTKLVEAEKNITVFYNLFVIDADTKEGRIRKVKALNGIEMRVYEFFADYFCDCTGDGWLGYYSGAKYRFGREAKHEFLEPLAPETPDSYTMSGCLMGTYKGKQILGYYAEDAHEAVSFQAPKWAVWLPEGKDLHRHPSRLHTGEWWIENATDWDDLWDQETVRDELLRLNLGYFHWLKNSYERRALTKNLEIKAFGKYNARRENRRLIGDYILTENDCVSGAVFEDAISYCGWPLDVHHPRGIYSGAEGPFYSNSDVKLSAIPYRCLYSKNIENLFFAGRCISVSHLALGTVRVESTLATLGQAVGTAAAYCIKHKVRPREIYMNHIKNLQQQLLKDDLYIPGIKNEDAEDLARNAKVSAKSTGSEVYETKRGVLTGWDDIATDLVMSCNYTPDMNTVKPMLKNGRGEAVTLSVTLVTMPSSGAFESMKDLESRNVTIPGNYEGCLPIEFDTAISGKDFSAIGLKIEKADGISWRKIDFCSDGRRRGRPIDERFWESDSSNSYLTIFKDEALLYADTAPSQVTNGQNRIIGSKEYAWVSDDTGLPQWLDLRWEEACEIGSVHLVLDTDMANPAYSYLIRDVIPQTVKDADIITIDEEGKEEIVSVIRGNYMRTVRVNFTKRKTKHLRIKVTGTWGSKYAKIIEVRVYN